MEGACYGGRRLRGTRLYYCQRIFTGAAGQGRAGSRRSVSGLSVGLVRRRACLGCSHCTRRWQIATTGDRTSRCTGPDPEARSMGASLASPSGRSCFGMRKTCAKRARLRRRMAGRWRPDRRGICLSRTCARSAHSLVRLACLVGVHLARRVLWRCPPRTRGRLGQHRRHRGRHRLGRSSFRLVVCTVGVQPLAGDFSARRAQYDLACV